MSTPARTASLYESGRTARRSAFFGRSGVRAALLTACGAMLVAGCNQVGGGLNSNLPPAGGGGLLSFTSVAMPDGIAGRAYSKVAVTSVETQAKTNFPISPAVASGTAPLASCTVSAGTLPPGMNAALTVDSTGAGCVISGTPSAAAAGNTYQFTIQALDSNSPPRAAAQTFTMKVRPEFTVTPPLAIVAGALPAGVQGRTYGQIAGNAAAMTATTNLSATNGNGAVGAKNYCMLSVTPPLATLTLTQVAGTNNCQLQGSAALASAGSYKVTVAVTDNPIVDPETNLAAVPANTIAAASNATLNVAAPLKIVAADAVSATPPAAVQGRAYGTGSGCSAGACSPLTYAATGGLPSVEPADSFLFSNSAALTAAGINCAATASSTIAKTTCSGTAGSAGTSNFSVTLDDAGNLATPGASASGTTASVSGLSLTVDSALSLAVSPDPATNPAVQNRAYGTGTGCSGAGGTCVAPTYTPSGGLGTYSFNVSGTPPTGIACAPNAGNTAVVCSGTAAAAAATSTFGVAASDVANASTPSATTAPVSKTLTVNGALTLTPPASLPPAVSGRAFGTGAGCSGGNCVPAAFAVSGGLGAYSATATVVSAPGAWTCSLAGSNYNCSSAAVVSGTPNLSITASDGASATTPGATTASATVAVAVDPVMTVAPLGGSAPDAVTGRSYGSAASGCSGGACLPLQYAVSGGLGNYQPGTLVVADSASDSLACTVAALTYSCSSGAINGNAAATAAMTMTAVEAGNTATPGGTANDASRTLTIQPAISLTPAAFAIAVNGRSYGVGATCGAAGNVACQTAQFAVSGGLGGYAANRTPSSAPGTWNCALASTNYDCSSASVSATGPFPASANLSLSAIDTGNTSTPGGTSATSTSSLTVNGPLTLGAPGSLAAAVNGRSYGTGSVCGAAGTAACQAAQFPVSGGLGGYAASPTPSAAPGTWNCALAGSNYDCSTSSVSAVGPFPTSANLSLSTSDTADASTPSGASGTATGSLTVDGVVTLAPTGVLAASVNGRSYGTGNSCGASGTSACQPAQFAVSGGLGTYAAAVTPSAAPGSWNCALVGSNYNCSSLSVSAAGPFPETATLTLSASDIANASTPSGSSSTANNTLTVDAALTLTPTGLLADAVTGRSYGTGNSCGVSGTLACQPAGFQVANGLGSYALTATVTAAPGGAPGTWTCNFAAPDYNCSATSVGGSGASSLSVTAKDVADASTPAATVATDPTSQATSALTVDGQLVLSVTPDPAVNPAVQGRVYGTGAGCLAGACQAPTYTPSSGGLAGAYTFSVTGTPPSGINCAPNGGSTAVVCSGTASPTAATSTFSVTVKDTANVSTPAATIGTDPQSTLSKTLAVNPALAINAITLPNGLVGYPYPTVSGASTLSATGGIGADTWVPPGGSGCSSTPTGTLPGLITVAASTGVISGTPSAASSSASDFQFQVCVFDTNNATTPTGSAFPNTTGNDLTLNVMAPLAYVTESDHIEVFNTQSQTSKSLISSTGNGPFGVAFSPSGRYAYVTLSNVDKLAVYDTITNAEVASSPLTLTSGCAPNGVAATANNVFIACNSLDEVDVVNVSGGTFTVGSPIAIGVSRTAPYGVAVSPDETRVYVTLSRMNELFIIDSSGTPAKLGGTNPVALGSAQGTVPFGIAVASAGGTGPGIVAYIAKQGASSSVPDGVEVITLTGDAFTDVPSANVITSSDSSAHPTFVAVTPDSSRVYVTLNNKDKFAVIDNTAATPAQLSVLLNETGSASEGVAVAPQSPLQAFIVENTTPGKIAVIDDSATTPAETASPISTGAPAPLLIATIQPPK